MSARLAANGVSVRLGSALAVDGVSLDLNAGELVALVGPNGAGKTTLMRALAGLIPADGAISLGGKPLASLTPGERAKKIAYLPQGHVFHWPMNVEAVVALGRHPHADAFSPLSSGDRDAVRAALAATSAEAWIGRPVTTLSGGERARVALARALATQAPILFADEPTASLDPRHQLVVMDLLRSAAQRGGTVLAIVHDLTLAARYADRIVVMDRGRIAADGAAEEALSAQRLASVFGVEAITVAAGAKQVPLPHRPL